MQKRIYVCLIFYVFVPYFRPEICEWGKIFNRKVESQC